MMRIKRISFVGVLLVIGFITRGQDVRAYLDSTTFFIGDQTRIHVHLNIADPADKVDFITSGIENDDKFELVAQSPLYKSEESSEVQYKREFLVAFFDTGAYYIPSMDVVINNAGNRDTVMTQSIPIIVKPIAVDSLLAPIKPIIEEPIFLSDYYWLFAVVGGVLLFLGIIIYLMRKAQKKKQDEIILPPKTPFQVANENLQILEKERLIAKNQIKEHYARLSIILRTYLEAGFGFPAAESTTNEIGYSLMSIGFNEHDKSNIIERLQTIDMIKYAKMRPDAQEVDGSTESMRMLIRRIHDWSTKYQNEEE